MDVKCPLDNACSRSTCIPFRVLTPNPLRTFWNINNTFRAFTTAWSILLSTPRVVPLSEEQIYYWPFSIYIPRGGLAMSPKSAGFAMSLLGIIGMALQLTVYPGIVSRLGTVKCYQYSTALFPLAYTLVAFLPLIQSKLLLWISIVFVLSILVLARTFALPATIVLLNNCSPHPSVLGTVSGRSPNIL